MFELKRCFRACRLRVAADRFWIAQFVRRAEICTQARTRVTFLCGEAKGLCKILDTILLFVLQQGIVAIRFPALEFMFNNLVILGVSNDGWKILHFMILIIYNNHDLDCSYLAYLL